MKVFISWSGENSRRIGEAIRNWLPSALQNVRPYFSPSDIDKGSRWSSEISKELASASVGLIILTPENLHSNWIMFEAGAISRVLESSRVCPLLFGVDETDLAGPLAQFQATKFSKEDFKALFLMINAALGDTRLADGVVLTVFEKWWVDLEQQVKSILKEHKPQPRAEAIRADRELIEEILVTVRNLAKESDKGVPRQSPIPASGIPYRKTSVGRVLAILNTLSRELLLVDDEVALFKRELEDLQVYFSQGRVVSLMTKNNALRDLETIMKNLDGQISEMHGIEELEKVEPSE